MFWDTLSVMLEKNTLIYTALGVKFIRDSLTHLQVILFFYYY